MTPRQYLQNIVARRRAIRRPMRVRRPAVTPLQLGAHPSQIGKIRGLRDYLSELYRRRG